MGKLPWQEKNALSGPALEPGHWRATRHVGWHVPSGPHGGAGSAPWLSPCTSTHRTGGNAENAEQLRVLTGQALSAPPSNPPVRRLHRLDITICVAGARQPRASGTKRRAGAARTLATRRGSSPRSTSPRRAGRRVSSGEGQHPWDAGAKTHHLHLTRNHHLGHSRNGLESERPARVLTAA